MREENGVWDRVRVNRKVPSVERSREGMREMVVAMIVDRRSATRASRGIQICAELKLGL